MVAPSLFDDHDSQPTSTPSASSPPPPASPPRGRFRRGFLAGVVALALAGGAGSGALAATLVGQAAQASTTGTTTTTSATSVQTATAAESIYQQVSPGVVTITASINSGFRGAGQATGSGIVLDTNGNILTNAHVIAGASQIQVTFSNGQTATATVVGSNTSADLAVLHVSVAASSLHPVTLGNSDNVQIGDSVYAIGSPFGLSGSLSEGIVSNLHQSGQTSNGNNLSGLIQTDAAINPGNSGGPLVNSSGQVIGINSSIESPVDGNVGVGFAIPINQVQSMLSSLEAGQNV